MRNLFQVLYPVRTNLSPGAVFMIDPKIIRDDIESIRKLLERRNMQGAVDVDELKAVDEERRALSLKSDELREKRNTLSKTIGQLKSQGKNADDAMKEVQSISDDIKKFSDRLEELNEKFKDLHLSIPNMLDASVPAGKDDKDNVVVREWGNKPEFSFTPKPHYEIGTDLGILDL
jgi:seryl-tRNA synthetase